MVFNVDEAEIERIGGLPAYQIKCLNLGDTVSLCIKPYYRRRQADGRLHIYAMEVITSD